MFTAKNSDLFPVTKNLLQDSTKQRTCYFLCSHYCLINIHIFNYPDSRLSGLFTQVPTSPVNRGPTVPCFCLQELEQELQSMLDRTKVKEKDARYGSNFLIVRCNVQKKSVFLGVVWRSFIDRETKETFHWSEQWNQWCGAKLHEKVCVLLNMFFFLENERQSSENNAQQFLTNKLKATVQNLGKAE